MRDMKAMVMTDIGRIEPGRLPVPSPGPGEALIRVKSVGICGSDVHYFHDGGSGDCKVEPPFLVGHECAGEVVGLGEGVQGLCVGDRVALEPGIPCGKCEMCMTGRYNLCPDVVFFATPPVQGVLCEYVAHPASLCFKLPDTLDFEEGALIEPLAVGFHAGLLGGARVGKSAAVLGSGCIGLVTLLAIRAMGVTEIYMSDVLDNRLAVAEKLGAVTVNAAKEDAVQAILEKTQGRGPLSPELLRAIAAGLLEMTNGAAAASQCGDSLRLLLTCALFLVSFGGASIFGQTLDLLQNVPLSPLRYALYKAINGLLSCVFFLFTYGFWEKYAQKAVPVFSLHTETALSPFCHMFLLCFLLGCFLLSARTKGRKQIIFPCAAPGCSPPERSASARNNRRS